MKKEDVRLWLAEALRNRRTLTLVAAILMGIAGLVTTLAEFILFLLILRIGFLSGGIASAFVSLLILAGIQAVVWLLHPKQLPDRELETDMESEWGRILIPPNMPAIWTYALGSLESDRSWVEILLGLLSLPQRMWCAAWRTFTQWKELETINVSRVAAVIRRLHREGESMAVSVLAEDLPPEEVAETMRHVAMIDGVVVLTRDQVSLNLAGRLVDQLHEWRQKHAAGNEGNVD